MLQRIEPNPAHSDLMAKLTELLPPETDAVVVLVNLEETGSYNASVGSTLPWAMARDVLQTWIDKPLPADAEGFT